MFVVIYFNKFIFLFNYKLNKLIIDFEIYIIRAKHILVYFQFILFLEMNNKYIIFYIHFSNN